MTDMPQDKNDQEARVIRALLDHLAAVGETAVLVEQPDRLAADQRTYPAVTSDALLRITAGGSPVDWAVDVTSLAAPSGVGHAAEQWLALSAGSPCMRNIGTESHASGERFELSGGSTLGTDGWRFTIRPHLHQMKDSFI